MNKELNINGQVYRLVEEEKPKQREPIKRFINLYKLTTGDIAFLTREEAERLGPNRIDCVELSEIPQGAKVVTREQLKSSIRSAQMEAYIGTDIWFSEFCKSLGFEVQE